MTQLHTRVRARHPFSIGIGNGIDGVVVIASKEEGRLATAEECNQLFNKTLPIDETSPFAAVVFRNLRPCVILRRQIEIL